MPYYNLEKECSKDHKDCWICPDCIDHPKELFVSDEVNCKNLIHLESGDTVQCACWSVLHEFGSNGEFAERTINRALKDATKRFWTVQGIMSKANWETFRIFVHQRMERLEKEIKDIMVNSNAKDIKDW